MQKSTPEKTAGIILLVYIYVGYSDTVDWNTSDFFSSQWEK